MAALLASIKGSRGLAVVLRRAVAGGALAFALPGAALACNIVPIVPSATPERRANCSYTHLVSEIRAVRLSEAVDLGGGFVLQYALDGNACYHERNIVLHDCAARDLVVVGPERADYPWDPEPPMFDIQERIQTEAEAGQPMTLTALTELAQSHGYADTLRVSVGTRLSINGYSVPSNCACDTYYPRASGG